MKTEAARQRNVGNILPNRNASYPIRLLTLMNKAVTSGCVNCDEAVGVPTAIQARPVLFVFFLEYIAAVIEDGASYECEKW